MRLLCRASIGRLLLVMVLLPGLGRTANGSTRWLNIGGLNIMQVSEPVRLMMLAAYAALQLLPLPYIWTISGIAIALSLVWAGIVARQARHAGTAQ